MNADRPIEDPHLKHLFDGNDALNVYRTDVIHLTAGAPGPDLLRLCCNMFEQATRHRLEKEAQEAFLFQYGIATGLWEFREELAKFLTKRYGDTVNRRDLILTCGATHGMQLILNTFVPHNAVIFVEELSYMIMLDVFKQFPACRVVPVAMDESGLDTDMLESIAQEEKKKGTWKLTAEKMFWGMVYTIPQFHNPTGTVLAPGRCEALVDVARRLGLLVVCDDVYNLLYYGTEHHPPRRLFSYDRKFCVISNGSFSKIMAPGVRVGWLEVPAQLALTLRSSGILRSGGGVNQFMSGLVTSMLQLGLQEKHLNHLIFTFKGRMEVLVSTLKCNLPASCSTSEPKGGYFVWITLPVDMSAEKFCTWCQRHHQVSAIPGPIFSVVGRFRNCLRLTIAFHNADKLRLGATRLCSALAEYLQ